MAADAPGDVWCSRMYSGLLKGPGDMMSHSVRRTVVRRIVTIAAAVALAATTMVGIAQAGQPARAGVVSSHTVLDEPSPAEQAQLRIVAAAIWDQNLADGWDMNSDVADVLSSATHAILICSEAFSLVPKPAGWVPGLGYLVKYAVNLKDYFQAVSGSRTYRTCVSGAAYNYRTPMDIASSGA